MNTDISVVRADVSEYETEVRELLLDYFVSANERGKEWFGDDDFGANVEDIVAADIERLASAAIAEPLFVALRDDRIVGSVQLKRLDETTAEVKRLYVKPAHRGKGIGRALMDAVLADAPLAGFETLRLGVAPYHGKARSLYRDLGFEFTAPYGGSQAPEEIQDDWHFMKFSFAKPSP